MCESQLDPFSLLFMAKQPATPAVACMLFMTVFWIAVASIYTWLCFHVKFRWWVGASCLCSSRWAKLWLQQQWRDLPVLASHAHGPHFAFIQLQQGHMPWQCPSVSSHWGGGGREVLQEVVSCPASNQPMSQMPEVRPGGCCPWSPFGLHFAVWSRAWHSSSPSGETKPEGVSQEDAQCLSVSRHPCRGVQEWGQKAPNSRFYGHEVFSNVWLCRSAPVTLHHLLIQTLRGSSLRGPCTPHRW